MSSTSKGVYWYTYCLNNPLRFTDPSGYYYGPVEPGERQNVGPAPGGGATFQYLYYGGSRGTTSRSGWDFGNLARKYNNGGSWAPEAGPNSSDLFDWSYNFGTGQYENRYSGNSMDPYSYNTYVMPSYAHYSGAKTYSNISNMGFVNGRFQFTSVPTPTKLVSNMQMGFNPSSGTMLQYDKSANEFYVPHTSITFSSYMQSLAASNSGDGLDPVYGSPGSELVTVAGSGASVYKHLPGFMAPTVHKHYAELNFKGGKPLGKLGKAGDFVSTSGAIINLQNDLSNPVYWADLFFAGVGWLPVLGDMTTTLYTAGKDQVYIQQDNIRNSRHPLRGVYVPGTGDVWFGF